MIINIVRKQGDKMNRPIVICENSFQIAWAKAILALSNYNWNTWNVLIHIDDPQLYDQTTDDLLKSFAERQKLIPPKHVAHTIFPQTFLKDDVSRDGLYKKYWRFFKLSRKKPHSGWGTYFERMIRYSTPKGDIDQLGSIIDNIKSRSRNYGASYAMVIPYPHRDLNKLMGAPCLNYMTIQVEYTIKPMKEKTINLLAVYRNHDFTERAYGNYLGLCNLLKYIARETDSSTGALTCVSSHAFVPKNREELTAIANNILGVEH